MSSRFCTTIFVQNGHGTMRLLLLSCDWEQAKLDPVAKECAGLGAEAFLLRASKQALGSRWRVFARMTGPKFGRVNEMKKVTPRRSRRLRPFPFEADSMELVVVPDAEFKESMDSVDDNEGG
ncbi:hypothetical protein ARMGADRAFT_1038825 [Armillaria gallica]|uniref:Uncharacterized protein n=1 Tax=Armillaria gallica TaxID=47427 RepID=A0A2H3CZP0_ARMGA|nr:hypothetical protein ARMGADRAFT_1038825 [Armillaria gallica]